ncbi:MAG: alpha-galactosidase [Lachnospiraceae bacterium]|nr:alpha-galactosidase [Lachnospiraceae bacterium]
MAIIYKEENKTFTLHTRKTTYQMKVASYGYLLHTYYGKKTEGDMSYLIQRRDRGFSGNPYEAESDRTFSLDTLPQEYSCQGNGDFRSVAFNVRNAQGVYGCDLRFRNYRIYQGKYELPGLPGVYGTEEELETLEITLADENVGVEVVLCYSVLEALDVITRAVRVKNTGAEVLTVTKAASAELDFVCGDYDVLHFHGRHGMEHVMERTPVFHGNQSFGSIRGASSHQHNPFLILAQQNTTEDKGECYGISFVYSGNFHGEVEKDQTAQTRMLMGIQDQMFAYDLAAGETFTAPEAALSCSSEGLSSLSQNFHRLIRYHICRGKFQKVRRPILINNWEATYFDFDGEKICNIARQASELGVEMLVLDDGWFGQRDGDVSGLGDWVVNEEKLGCTMGELSEKINQIGMKFGLWIEPEMISENSDLYRAHPDWAFAIPGKNPVRSRHQLVLDFSREEVVDYIYSSLEKVISHANISYLKMDMNRSITDVYTAVSGYQNHGKILYQFVLGVYRFLDKINTRFPDLFVEGCSGGGGRFDAGMLYYTPQIWCSDNTDAVERLAIQKGTSYGYPISAVGSHVSIVPNHQTGRVTSLKTRGVVAMAGSFGYELDLGVLSEEEKELVKQQIADYRKYWNLIQNGDYYRLEVAGKDTALEAWMFVAEDASEALVNVVTLEARCNGPVAYVKLRGLKEAGSYRLEGTHQVLSGSALMYGGLPVPHMNGEYQAWQVHLTEIGESAEAI